MVTVLQVVNDCLAIMGEAPLNAIAERHAFKTAAINTLTRVSNTIQGVGWWYNMEKLVVTASPVDSRILIPNDVVKVLPSHEYPNIVKRGRVLYNTDKGTDLFDIGQSYTIRAIRVLDLELVPDSVADLIAGQTVLEFQQQYDGDQTKTRNQKVLVDGIPGQQLGLRGIAMAEHILNRRTNLIQSSERLHRITSRVNYSRRPG